MSKSCLPVDKLSDHALEILAGNGAFERGKSYASHLRVVSLRQYRGEIHATVEGREDYKELAQKHGNWKQLRRDVFTFVKNRKNKGNAGNLPRDYRFFGTRKDVSLLVELHIADGDPQKADRLARTGFCHDRVLVILAEALKAIDPARAANIYEKRIQQLLADEHALAYNDNWRGELNELLSSLKICCDHLGDGERLQSFMQRLILPQRVAYKTSVLEVFARFLPCMDADYPGKDCPLHFATPKSDKALTRLLLNEDQPDQPDRSDRSDQTDQPDLIAEPQRGSGEAKP